VWLTDPVGVAYLWFGASPLGNSTDLSRVFGSSSSVKQALQQVHPGHQRVQLTKEGEVYIIIIVIAFERETLTDFIQQHSIVKAININYQQTSLISNTIAHVCREVQLGMNRCLRCVTWGRGVAMLSTSLTTSPLRYVLRRSRNPSSTWTRTRLGQGERGDSQLMCPLYSVRPPGIWI